MGHYLNCHINLKRGLTKLEKRMAEKSCMRRMTNLYSAVLAHLRRKAASTKVNPDEFRAAHSEDREMCGSQELLQKQVIA